VRIDLADEKRDRRGRGKGRRRRGRHSRTFETAISLPQTSSRSAARGGRTQQASRKSRRPVEHSQTRRSRTRQATHTESAAPPRGLRAIRWRSVALRLPALAVVAALIGLCIHASTDARFFVYEAQIVGTHHLSAGSIYEVAGVHEQNIFWIDPQTVAERVIQLEGIEAVYVRCELPAVVSIEVVEREPVVMWRATSQQQDLWLDEEGVVLPYHGDVNSPDIVFVVDYGERSLQVGDRIEPEGIVQSVLQLAATVPGVRVFAYRPGQGLSFTQGVDGGEWPVYVGTSADLARKIQVLQALTGYLQSNTIVPRYVDVRWADHPVYGRPSGESGGGSE
jgi:cell division septal protein FtsQ